MKKAGKRSKIIAMYLPQYHEIPENNEWWGNGFTDWISVKEAKALFNSHEQPKKPYKGRYYDLSKPNTLKWQSELTKEYGIDGLAFYHYWFSSNLQLLEKPAELLLTDKTIVQPFCFAWDNGSWIRTWSKFEGNAWTPKYDSKESNKQEGMLAKLDYGNEEDWKKHFDYLLPFFQDERYIKKDKKPVFMILNYKEAVKLKKMCHKWKEWAKDAGLNGVYFIGRQIADHPNNLLDAEYTYEPLYSGWQQKSIIKDIIEAKYEKIDHKKKPRIYSYDYIWLKILYHAWKCKTRNVYFGGFVNYDDTPRRAEQGRVIRNGNANKFAFYLKQLVRISMKQEKEFIFLTAWNEWGEGAYLEPDSTNKYEHLKAIKRIRES